jgi:ribosomal protein L40E
MQTPDDDLLICHRCGALLTPGRGDFYVVHIAAVADPSPPVISAEDLARDHAADIAALARAMEELSEQELMDQVHRQLTLHLCTRCYRQWIEHPTG